MLVKRPNREKRYLKFIKGIIVFEVVLFSSAYIIWNRMNHSRDFRYFLHRNCPKILEGFYQLGKTMNKNYVGDVQDKLAWERERKI